MRKNILLVISFILILNLASCSNADVYEEIIISDIKEYEEVWSLPERRADEKCILFPEQVSEEQCVTFACKHTTYQLVGTGWQLSLEVRYNDDLFLAEKDRLLALCTNSPICEYSEYFDASAYATVWNWNSCFEYAVIDEKEKTVCYIYLQLIEKKDLTINEKWIPKGYEMQLTNSETYSVYE